MEKLETKSIAIQNHMYDSVPHDFDRLSDYHYSDSTPLQGQEDEQTEAVISAENAIEHDAIDILTEYPPWSTETYDICDDDEVIYDRNRKEIQDELYKETPVKTKYNKPYSTFSENSDQECPCHDFCKSQFAVHYIQLYRYIYIYIYV